MIYLRLLYNPRVYDWKKIILLMPNVVYYWKFNVNFIMKEKLKYLFVYEKKKFDKPNR
jgi:hypothetical protein